jgi:hypothetical protein
MKEILRQDLCVPPDIVLPRMSLIQMKEILRQDLCVPPDIVLPRMTAITPTALHSRVYLMRILGQEDSAVFPADTRTD